MRYPITNANRKQLLTIACMLLAMVITAQEAAPVQAAARTASQSNMALYIMIGGMAVLLFAIAMLGSVMVSLARIIANKDKAVKTTTILFLMLFALPLFSQQAAPAAAPVFWTLEMILGALILGVEFFVLAMMLLRIRGMLKQIAPATEQKTVREFHMPKLFDRVNASVAIEEEHDIMLDHNYDGIRELDNNLPPWWKYGFYLTIVYAVIYMFYFHVGSGLGSEATYHNEMAEARIAVEEYTRKNASNVDENNVKMADAAGIAEGKMLYNDNCKACHGANCEGAVGPNLTDDYWLHGGSMSHVFKSVKYGWPAKGMKSWQAELSPVQIKDVVSYIKSLQGTKPANAKEPQGDLYKEDNMQTKTDSLAIAVK